VIDLIAVLWFVCGVIGGIVCTLLVRGCCDWFRKNWW
jgi:hypothetical protein